ncbi:8007_t:CDS:2 [Acaulospora morrowiae]|uniref:8007_t:CDS:1 n=1 Tax=Acaulospora morrowiae TaxID=94023 RepID=A0A9N9F0N4_9GLOM|nr:8007_t:CDS:2 [Acaulospora morrowiae]
MGSLLGVPSGITCLFATCNYSWINVLSNDDHRKTQHDYKDTNTCEGVKNRKSCVFPGKAAALLGLLASLKQMLFFHRTRLLKVNPRRTLCKGAVARRPQTRVERVSHIQHDNEKGSGRGLGIWKLFVSWNDT